MDPETPNADDGAGAPSIEDTLNATFDAIQARPDDGAAVDTPDASDADAPEGEAADTDTAPEGDAETTDQAGAEDAGTAEQPLSPPERWSAADKAEFASLSREAQSLVLKREADVERHLQQETQKIADIKRNYEPLERHIGPRREAWALAGYTPDTALEHLFALSDFATRDKEAFIGWFAQQHGVDLGKLVLGGDNAPDPQIKALNDRLARFEQTEQQRQQQAQEQSRQTVKSAVEQFAADTKAHPHWKDVENDIALLLPGIKQQNPGASHNELLQIAYDKAIRVNDTVSAKIQAEQKKADDLAAAAAARKAKLAKDGNVKSQGSLPDGRRKLTMDETMSETYDRHTAGA